MSLEDFVGKRKVNVLQLAKQIGYSRVYLQQVLNGKMIPGKKLAKCLEEVSEGKITAEELLKPRKDQKQDNLDIVENRE